MAVPRWQHPQARPVGSVSPNHDDHVPHAMTRSSITAAAWTSGPALAYAGDALVVGGDAPGAELLIAPRRRGAGTAAPPPSREHLTEADLRQVEETFGDGITAVQIVDVFVSRGIRFTEATFRKYVQLGLLPRSRRIGRKGKNKGSLGMYPAKTVRRIDHVKRLMLEGYTIEQIAAQFLQFTDLIENVSEALTELFDRLDLDVAAPDLDAAARRGLAKELAEARRHGDALVERLNSLTQRALAPRAAELRKAGAADDAEDLL